MSTSDPDECWSLVREPKHLEPSPWLIQNTRFVDNSLHFNSIHLLYS